MLTKWHRPFQVPDPQTQTQTRRIRWNVYTSAELELSIERWKNLENLKGSSQP